MLSMKVCRKCRDCDDDSSEMIHRWFHFGRSPCGDDTYGPPNVKECDYHLEHLIAMQNMFPKFELNKTVCKKCEVKDCTVFKWPTSLRPEVMHVLCDYHLEHLVSGNVK